MHNMSDEQQHAQQKRLQQQHQEQLQQQHKMCKDNSVLAATTIATTAATAAATRVSPTAAVSTTTATPPTPTAAGGAAAASTPRKTNPHEMRNSEFVSRLMAATPPYLYSAPVGPNNFFFSDMLRSLVQARNNENVRNLQLQQSIIARRSRKRSWSAQHAHQRPAAYVEHKAMALPQHQESSGGGGGIPEKPLELTNKAAYFLGGGVSSKYRKLEEPNGETECEKKPSAVTAESIGSAGGGTGGAVDGVQDTPAAASLPPQDLVLPPPPIWYPPHLYPPYGIDPLHFFIDLRVSGHIYDRKKENLSPLTAASAENNNSEAGPQISLPGGTLPLQLPQKYRHGSAFSVPVPRGGHERKVSGTGAGLGMTAGAAAAINLSSKFEHYAKYYDFGEEKEKEKENQPTPLAAQPPVAANYMLQQLPRLYSQFAAGQAVAAAAQAAATNANASDGDPDGDGDNKSEPDCDADGDSDVDGGGGADVISGSGGVVERDIDVEFIDSIQRTIKYHRRGLDTAAGGDDGAGGSSRCSSADESSITQID